MFYCDICGTRAVVSVLDYSETINPNGLITRNPMGPIKRFCNDHRKESKCIAKFDELMFSSLVELT